MSEKRVKKIMKENLGIVVEQGSNIAIEAAVDGIVGTFASGIVSAKYSYKQRKHEENVQAAIDKINARMDQLESGVTDDNYEYVNRNIFPMMWDYVIDEDEREKIELIINGFESAIEDSDLDEELTRTYFDILKSLRLNELRFLLEKRATKRGVPKVNRWDFAVTREVKARVSREEGFDSYIVNKLERLGLVKVVILGKTNTNQLPLTNFGENFLMFFKQ